MYNKIISSVVTFSKQLLTTFRKLSRNQKILTVAVIVLVSGGIIFSLVTTKSTANKDTVSLHTVTLLSVGEYSTNLPSLSLIGNVRSQSEATVTAEAQGIVSRVYYSLGDSVKAGTVIAELENGSERAGLLQAQASRDVASANLDKVKRGTRDEQLSVLVITRDNAQATLKNAELSAENALRASYASLSDSIQRHLDETFSNPSSNQPSFIPQTSNSQAEIDAESGRLALQSVLAREASIEQSGTIPNLDAELTKVAEELATARNVVTTVITALNAAIPTTSISEAQIATWRTDANTALSNISASRSTILSTIDTLASRRASLQIAEKNFEQGQTGGQLEDIQGAEASKRQAEASVLAAQVAFQKTLLRAPISGTIEAMDLEQGQFVSALSSIAQIANINALEIITYASQNDLPYLQVGAEVLLNNDAQGIVTRVATSLDPSTKRIEVRIGVQEGSSLTNGQSVEVAIARLNAVENVDIRVPLSAIKITADSAFVFSLTDAHLLEEHEISIESILGSDAVITGILPTLTIVKDARGLHNGEEVKINN